MICMFKAMMFCYVFQNFPNMSFEIYELGPTCFLNAPGLAWKAALKKEKSKIRYAFNVRIRYHGWNMLCYLSIC